MNAYVEKSNFKRRSESQLPGSELCLRATTLSITIALLKSVIGWFYYLKYLSLETALAGGLFSSLHNLVFTGFPLAEQKLLLAPIRKWIGVPEGDCTVAKNLDVFFTAIHKLLNLGLVSTLLNWSHLNFKDVIYDAGVTALIYTLIKSFWKIHFDYQLKTGVLSTRSYHFILPTLELIAFALMPALMLGMNWAIILSVLMATSGVFIFIKGNYTMDPIFKTRFNKEKD